MPKEFIAGVRQMHRDSVESLGPPTKAGSYVSAGIELVMAAFLVMLLSPMPGLWWLGTLSGGMILCGGVIFFVGCCLYINSGDSYEDLQMRFVASKDEMHRRIHERQTRNP